MQDTANLIIVKNKVKEKWERELQMSQKFEKKSSKWKFQNIRIKKTGGKMPEK